MEFEANIASLKRQCLILKKTASSILLSVDNGCPKIYAADSDFPVRCDIKGTSIADGSAAIQDLRKFKRVLTKLKKRNEVAVFRRDDEHLVIETKATGEEIRIPHTELDTAPTKLPAQQTVHEVESGILYGALKRLLPHVATDTYGGDAKKGVLVRPLAEKARVFSTDGYTMAVYDVPLDFGGSKKNIDGQSLKVLQYGLKKQKIHTTTEDIGVTFGDDYAWFEAGYTTIGCPYVEGTYPNVDNVIENLPDQPPAEFTGSADEILASLETACVVTEQDRVGLEVSKDGVYLSSIQNQGEYRNRIAEGKGEKSREHYTLNSLKKTLGGFDTDDVTVEFAAAKAPTKWKEPNSGIAGYTLIMPARK